MTSNELTVAHKGGSAVQYVDPAKVDYAVRSRWLSQQNTGGGRVFAGRQLRCNGQKGVYTEYVNKSDKKKKSLTFVLNVANCYAAWQYWPEGEAPSYPHIINIFGHEDAVLPSRAMVGPHETKRNKLRKEDEDVWSEVPVLIMRDVESDQIYHWVGNGISQRMTITTFLEENADEFGRHKGKLPVVELGFEETPTKDGGTYEKPTITIVEWVKPTAMDNPKGLASSVETSDDDEDEDDEDLKSKSRVKSRTTAKKVVEEDDEDEDEDEDEDAPSTKLAKSKRSARQAELSKKYASDDDDDDDDDDDEDDEDERPAPKAKGKSKGADGKAVKRKVAPVEDDEDEDEDDDEDDVPAPRKRRGR